MKHKPIKFEPLPEQGIVKKIKNIVDGSGTAKTAMNVVLALATTGGILTVGAVTPNLLGLVHNWNKKRKAEKWERYRILWQNFNKLKKQRAVEFIKEDPDGALVYRLSPGQWQGKIRKFMFDEITIKKPRNWDGRWRLVLFDIPERHKKARLALARKLNELGFYQTQKSAWVHPFPCHEEIGFVTDVFNIKPYVKIFLVEEMTDGKTLYYFKDVLKQSIVR